MNCGCVRKIKECTGKLKGNLKGMGWISPTCFTRAQTGTATGNESMCITAAELEACGDAV